MLVIVADRRRISKNQICKMNGIIAKATGEQVASILVNDYADAIRIFRVECAPTMTIDELRSFLIHPKPSLMDRFFADPIFKDIF